MTFHDDTSHALTCPHHFNLADYVLFHGQAAPQKRALRVVGAQDYSYGFLQDRVLSAATLLKARGIHSGQRVMLRISNSAAFPIAFLATAALDAVPVVTSAQLTKTEVDQLATVASPDAIIASTGMPCPDHAGLVVSAEQLMDAPTATIKPILGNPNRPGYIVFTSGTSGRPKAVVHAHRAVWARRMMWNDWYGLRSDDILYHAGAFNWTFTLGTGLLDPWAKGATALVAPDNAPDWRRLRDEHVSLFAAAPGVIRQMLKSPAGPAFPSLRRGLTAGDRLSGNLRQQWQNATNTALAEAFGMTECSTFLSDRPAAAPGLRPQHGRRIKVTDTGRIAIHHSDPGLMLGYLEAHPSLPLTSGWFETNDLGHQHSNGTVEFLARDSDILNAGGFRISPAEIEDHFTTLAALSDVAVTEVEIKPDVHVIALFYCACSNVCENVLKTHAAKGLAAYKQPRIYQQIADLPRTANGKLNRKALPQLWRP